MRGLRIWLTCRHSEEKESMGDLNLPTIAQGQQSMYQTSNDADAALEAALVGNTAVDLSASDVALTSTQFTRSIAFLCGGNSVARTLTVPAGKRLFVVRNNGSAAVTVQCGTGTGTVAAGDGAGFYTDGTTNGLYTVVASGASGVTSLFGQSGAITAIRYDVATYYPGVPGASQTLLRYTAARAIAFPNNLVGSVCSVGTNPTSTATLTIKKNGTSVGSISIATSGAATFTSSGFSLASGDVLTITAQASPDATLADPSVTLAGSA
jgi:hypothetical protein